MSVRQEADCPNKCRKVWIEGLGQVNDKGYTGFTELVVLEEVFSIISEEG
jgi:hypothetical protein